MGMAGFLELKSLTQKYLLYKGNTKIMIVFIFLQGTVPFFKTSLSKYLMSQAEKPSAQAKSSCAKPSYT